MTNNDRLENVIGMLETGIARLREGQDQEQQIKCLRIMASISVKLAEDLEKDLVDKQINAVYNQVV